MLNLFINVLVITISLVSSEWTYDNIQDWTMCQCSTCDYQHSVELGLNSDKLYQLQMSLSATSTNWNRQNIMGSWVTGSFTICLGRDFRYNECGCLTFTESVTSLDLQAVLGETCINTGNIIATVYCGGAYGTLNLNGYVRWQEDIPPTPLPTHSPTKEPTAVPTAEPTHTPTIMPTTEPTLSHSPTVKPTITFSSISSNATFWDNPEDKILFGSGMVILVLVMYCIVRWYRLTYEPIVNNTDEEINKI